MLGRRAEPLACPRARTARRTLAAQLGDLHADQEVRHERAATEAHHDRDRVVEPRRVDQGLRRADRAYRVAPPEQGEDPVAAPRHREARSSSDRSGREPAAREGCLLRCRPGWRSEPARPLRSHEPACRSPYTGGQAVGALGPTWRWQPRMVAVGLRAPHSVISQLSRRSSRSRVRCSVRPRCVRVALERHRAR